MLHMSQVEQLLSVQVISRVPLFCAQAEVVVLLREGAGVSSLTRVLLRTTTPRDVRPVNLFVCLLTFLYTCVC